eukprot:41982-Eustigmatos_ZCMA.PRE.1
MIQEQLPDVVLIEFPCTTKVGVNGVEPQFHGTLAEQELLHRHLEPISSRLIYGVNNLLTGVGDVNTGCGPSSFYPLCQSVYGLLPGYKIVQRQQSDLTYIAVQVLYHVMDD